MSVLVAERERDFGIIRELGEDSFEKAMSYIAYLRSIEEAEEAEDVACFDTRKDEPTVSLEQVVENYRKKYGLHN